MSGHMNGQGTAIAFGTSTFTAEVLGVTPPNMTRPVIDVTHLGTEKFKAFEPGDLVDGGDASMRIAYFPSDVPPMRGAPEIITITCADSGATTISFSGFITALAIGEMSEDQRVEATITLKCAGEVSIDGAVVGA